MSYGLIRSKERQFSQISKPTKPRSLNVSELGETFKLNGSIKILS